MRKGNTVVVGLVIAALVIAAVFILSRQDTTIAPEKEAPTQTPSPGGQKSGDSGIVEGDQGGQPMQAIDITIKNFTFAPSSLTVKKGTKVTWKNEDTAPHTVTAADNSFDSGRIATGQTFSHTFDTAGTFDYVCMIHPNMKAKVIVQ